MNQKTTTNAAPSRFYTALGLTAGSAYAAPVVLLGLACIAFFIACIVTAAS